ncbi:MarR family transcriptional regulator [Streptantibioticus cattleyicolor]|uniref:MarR family transcriptional regulator n=1 Tax=Streptantibioticus cattleyicolor (strain ATCC 35852 / DSM 46488 / JCM 4925 / NBRC 14057 / NRRL 8057) TaxID=1003195 RepID=F8JJ99_STREN|nr:helix-turn-helix domain-containing protein [Streptantibioticus cattleyicolor]AEW98791.1 MarR family transcriptional regulator [Streptantibioticus cattleyicolor NRRL 8057 = DSM 46488]CCB72158.1 Transcriptional regulator, MarR family [Streptantibioticus cattleyicolor NRRL 8057 = DSM 46488]
MDGVRLLGLGKRLTELGREVMDGAGPVTLTPGEIAVVADVLRHPGSSVREIGARTGFAQSHVSNSVARLRERGLLETARDSADGRRTLVRPTARARRAVRARADRPADEVIAAAVPDAATARRVTALLDELSGLLLPPR